MQDYHLSLRNEEGWGYMYKETEVTATARRVESDIRTMTVMAGLAKVDCQMRKRLSLKGRKRKGGMGANGWPLTALSYDTKTR